MFIWRAILSFSVAESQKFSNFYIGLNEHENDFIVTFCEKLLRIVSKFKCGVKRPVVAEKNWDILTLKKCLFCRVLEVFKFARSSFEVVLILEQIS